MSETVSQSVSDGQTPSDAVLARRSHAVKMACLAVILYVMLKILTPLVPVPLRPVNPAPWILLQVLVTLAFMVLQLWVPWALWLVRPAPKRAIIFMLVSAVTWAGMAYLTAPHRGWSRHQQHDIARFSGPLADLFLTASLAWLGGLIALIVREAKILLPIGIVAAIIDVMGAMLPTGFTANVMAKHENVVKAVSVSVPTVGSLHPMTIMGPGDALFLGFFFATVIRFGMNGRGSFWLTYALLTVSMLLVLAFGFPIGALMPMGIAMLAANFRYFKYSREETFAMLYAGAIVIAGAVAFFAYTNRFVFHPHH